MTVIDVHSHFLPAPLVAAAREGKGFERPQIESVDGQEWFVQEIFRQPLVPGLFELEARLADMDAMDIDRAVLSISPMLFFYWADPAGTVEFCQMTNDWLAEFVAGSQGRLSATATLPMQDTEAAVRELERAVRDLGMVGAEIAPFVEERPLDHPEVLPVLEAADRLGVPLILHPYPPATSSRLEDFYLRNFIGNPLQTTIAVARLIFSGVLDRLSSLELVLLHGGGFLPYQIGRFDHGYRVRSEAQGCACAPSEYLSRFAFDTITHRPDALDYLIRTVGADHVVYGTDYPYDMAGGPLAEQLGHMKLSEADYAQVAEGTAARVFGLPDGASPAS
jgi:aminocarboxymuconate-semialdehyde decarboxylase